MTPRHTSSVKCKLSVKLRSGGRDGVDISFPGMRRAPSLSLLISYAGDAEQLKSIQSVTALHTVAAAPARLGSLSVVSSLFVTPSQARD